MATHAADDKFQLFSNCFGLVWLLVVTETDKALELGITVVPEGVLFLLNVVLLLGLFELVKFESHQRS